MEKQILFNHIPKTGGTTLRVILNRVYGEQNVFFIESRNIGKSLEIFGKLTQDERNSYKAIAGHGAELFLKFLDDPYRIIILREPISLFLSQYAYLKVSPNSNYQKEIQSLKSIEEYLEFAVQNGQDNMQTRFLSQSEKWLIDKDAIIPMMETEGEKLLAKAILNLNNYDAVFDLEHFESGVYMLGKKLNWPHIPVYRPVNVNRKKKKKIVPSPDFLKKLKHTLRFDIALYQDFKTKNLDISTGISAFDFKYKVFKMRQSAITKVSKFTTKA